MPCTKSCPAGLTELEEVAVKYGTPYQLYDEEMMVANIKGLLDAYKEHFPTFQQFFAVKALPNPAILRLLVNAGCGLDCSSTSELFIAKELGVPGDKVRPLLHHSVHHPFENRALLPRRAVTLLVQCRGMGFFCSFWRVALRSAASRHGVL